MVINCSRCKEEKEHTKEFFKSNVINNKEYLERVCKNCRNEQARISARKRNQDSAYAKKRKEYLKEYSKNHYRDNIEYYKARNIRLKDHYRELARKNYNPEKEKARYKKRMESPTYKISKIMSNRINKLIRDKNFTSILDIVEFSISDLMKHLESQFRDGMTWENYGPYWHIDHIKPVSHFNFNSKDDLEFKECWSLSNLQPLLRHENLSKGARFIG